MQNKIKFISLLLGASLLLSTAQIMAGLPGESIVLDPSTGDYAVTYWDSDNPDDPDARVNRIIYVPNTKINPRLHSAFKLIGKGDVVYSYRVNNGIKSKQPLISMLFDPVKDIISSAPLPKNAHEINVNNIEQIMAIGTGALNAPANWSGRTTTSRVGGLRIGWSFDDLNNANDGLAPGRSLSGFGLLSSSIPGIIMAKFRGNAPVQGYPDEGPRGELAKELELIKQSSLIALPAAVPSISVPTPFNAATLLDSIQTQMHTWIAMQLLDASFSSQLDRYLTSAADAYRHNQPKAGKEHIQTLRKMLKKEHEDADKDDEKEDGKHEGKNDDKSKRLPIDRLAARVLDFDLKYVLKRMADD